MVIPLLHTITPSYPRTYQDTDVEEPINKLQHLPAQASSLPGERPPRALEQSDKPHVFHPDFGFGTIQIWGQYIVKKPLALRTWSFAYILLNAQGHTVLPTDLTTVNEATAVRHWPGCWTLRSRATSLSARYAVTAALRSQMQWTDNPESLDHSSTCSSLSPTPKTL